MKQQLNEVKRLQKLAGIIKESQRILEGPLATQLLKKADAAIKAGQNVTVQGKPIKKIVIMAGAFLPSDGTESIRISNLQNPLEDVLVDGKPIDIEVPDVKPNIDTRSPEEKAKAAQDWQDKYGPGGSITGYHGD